MNQLDFSRGDLAGLTFEQQVSKCRSKAAEANSLAADGREEKTEQYLEFAAKWSGLADEMERFANERRLKRCDVSAITAFLAGGGKIVKIPEALLVTAQDVLEFLKSCGIAATSSGRETKVYCCEGKPMKLSGVVALANRQRRARQLPPFVV